ncbi:hypothetical protein MVEN_01719700 [Mycena venus]|uniref:Concanavalin A-like lectin/glucanase n=1 Tax=Mycena venus TaxID=2733690 RepID=A0A8H6XM90_9AGAR|nr:hypothetical protein MVEN_01719700 [Mycena venus]
MHISAAVGLLTSFALALAKAAPSPEHVLTPGGYRPRYTVHAIPAGGSLAHSGSEIQVLAANGSIVTTAVHPSNPKTSAPRTRALETDGWIAYAWWLNPGLAPISSFTTTWEVPPVPATDHGQTVFLFNGLQPNGSSAILQPVLQYGPSNAGGGSFWAVATWYVDGTGHAFFTTPVPVTTGTTLDATVTLTGTNGSSSFSYNSQFSNIPGTSMNITGVPELTFAMETLEAYGVTAISDYPAGFTVFSGIDLRLVEGATPSMSWSFEDDMADGVLLAVDKDGPTDAQMTITY